MSSSNSWTDSFANIQCYDSLKVQAILNEIDGLNHDGSATRRVPNVLGMNFQAVSIGEKLVEKSDGADRRLSRRRGHAVTAAARRNPIRRCGDRQNGGRVEAPGALRTHRDHHHRQARPIADRSAARSAHSRRMFPAINRPPAILSPNGVGPGYPLVQALEDDISLLWLADNSPSATLKAAASLEANAAAIGANGGEIFYGRNLALMFNDPAIDPRTPNIIVAPNVGVIYTGGKKNLSEHGGFAHDDTTVMMLVSNPGMLASHRQQPGRDSSGGPYDSGAARS